MIKQIIKCLRENQDISDFLINETATESHQAFYVLQKLETNRSVATTEYSVTVYHRYLDNGNEYVGSSTFNVNHKLSKKELTKKIDEAIFAAKFIKNKSFNLVNGEKKKSWKEKEFEMEPFALIDKVATTFISEAKPNVKFNSLEVFYTKTTNHIVNSQGVDLKKTLLKVNVEAIPSYDGEDHKVELYKYYTYNVLDFDAMQKDAKSALEDVTSRYLAKNMQDLNKVDILLRDEDVARFFDELIADYSYASVYRNSTDKKIGDLIQKDAKKDKLTISLIPSSKKDAFDRDGVLLNPVTVIQEGKLVSYYGDNQYAQYLGVEPTGIMNTVKVEKGKASLKSIAKKPYLEIIALSNIQIELYNDYIGGEVRLAVFFDGENYHPLSGFSFSGSIDSCINNIILSKETIAINHYQGPKYIKLIDMDIL